MSSEDCFDEATPAAVERQRFIGPQPQPQPRDYGGHPSTAGPGNAHSQSGPRPAAAASEVVQFQGHIPISGSRAAPAAAAAKSAASKKRPSRTAASLRYHPPSPPLSSIHTLLRERQRRGRPLFLARPAAGVWSQDPLHRAFAGSAHALRRLELSGELRGHGGCVNTVSCTPDGRYWITGSDDMKLMIWDCESHVRKSSFSSGHHNNVFQARALPYTDNEKIVTCAADGQVRLTYLSRATSTLLGRHEGRAHRLAIEPGSPHRFMTCGEDGVVLSFDLRTSFARSSGSSSGSSNRSSGGSGGVPLLEQPGGRGISGMALNPSDPNYVFVCGDSPFLDCYDARKVDSPAARYCPRILRHARSAHITGVAVNWCGSEVVATYNPSGLVYRFDVKKNAVGNAATTVAATAAAAATASSASPSSSSSDDDRADSPGWRGGRRSVRQRRMEMDRAAGSDGGIAPAPASGSTGSTGGGHASSGDGTRNSIREGGRREEKEEEDEEEKEEEDEEEEKEEEEEEVEQHPHEEEREGEDTSFLTRFIGHRNVLTVKQVTFYGPRSEFVVSGSDCGHIFFWDKSSAKMEMLLWGDRVGAVNCLEPHPFLPALATSGLAETAKVWRPTRPEAVVALVGKRGKPAADVVRDNRERARNEREGRRRRQITITHEMFLRLFGMAEAGEGEAAEESGAMGGAERGGEAAAAGDSRRAANMGLRARLALLHRVMGLGSGDDSNSNSSDSDDDNNAHDDEEEEEEEAEGGENSSGEGADSNDESKGGTDADGEEKEGQEQQRQQQRIARGTPLQGVTDGGLAAAAAAGGLSFEVVSSGSDGGDDDDGSAHR